MTEGIDHLVCFADRHPWHVAAQRVALRRGITPLSDEFVYLRPDRITLELGGQSNCSHFPNRLEVIRAHAATLPAPEMTPRFSYPHVQAALADVADHLGNALFRPFLPQFVSDRFRHPVVEYLALAAKSRVGRGSISSTVAILWRLWPVPWGPSL